ncbi:hypothetical protein BDM02DRAFT_1083086 [Thelephora ganbajun]|uniref:Uncharacterized protein n=1 Tax=Thelephora ganbajun TaxID=370292 RepID=A0ACB6ZW27_THEGA|nr:hypothetical protein BDM02DRAFT_1083086 [Thelephora ganbajun]
MRLSNALSPLADLRYAIGASLWPTILDIYKSPSLFFRPAALSQVIMAHIWVLFGNPTDEGGRPTKQRLITPNAHGVVLDVGAGHGHTVGYLDRNKVTKYLALEPNTRMHAHIRTSAHSAGFNEDDGTLVILSCGAEDVPSILEALRATQPPVDTIISILTFCSIPSPERTIRNLVRDVLKPGGQLLFYEHMLSPREDVAWWQRAWAPIWAMPFDGCRLDRPVHSWIDDLTLTEDNGMETSAWSERMLWGKEGEDEENLWWHQVGKFVKQS